MNLRYRQIPTAILAVFLMLVALPPSGKAGWFDPPLPIEVTFRDPLFGSGRVLRLLNKSGKSLEVVFTWKSRTTGNVKRWSTTLADSSMHGEYGHMEGFPFASGDTVTISHPDYQTFSVTVP